MTEAIQAPWPWYIAGPLIGMIVPLLLLLGGKAFGISSAFRHLCAASVPGRIPLFQYDWRREGGWNLLFALGILIGGCIAALVMLPPGYSVAISEATQRDSRWAGGCTSGHAISGLAALQRPSMLAVLGFFAGGLLMTHVIMPLLFGPS